MIKNYFFIFILCLATCSAYLYFAPKQYAHHLENDINTQVYSDFALNLGQYPFSKTHGIMAEILDSNGTSFVQGQPATYYTNHPPGVIYWTWFAQNFFKNDFFAARALAAFSCFLMLAFVAMSILSVSGLRGAALSLGLMASLPMVWGHALTLDFQQVTGFWSTIAVILVARAECLGDCKKQKLYLGFGALAWFFAMLTDWPGYFMFVFLGLVWVYRRKWVQLGLFIGISALAAGIVFGLNFSPTIGMQHGAKGLLGAATSLFLNNNDQMKGDLSFVEALAGIRYYWDKEFGQLGLITILVLLALIWQSLRLKLKLLRPMTLAFCSLVVAGILNELLFYQWAAIHSYWRYYFIPTIGLGFFVLQEQFQITKKNQVLLGGLFVILALMSWPESMTRIKHIVKQTENESPLLVNLVENKMDQILASHSKLYALSDEPYRGYGSVNRKFVAKQLELLQSNTALDSGKLNFLVLSEREFRQGNPFPDRTWVHLNRMYWYVTQL